jgi:LmbE family N-acetylglucosaminyl deacetylase
MKYNEEGVQRLKILAIGAHFDDIEVGAGGTLKKHSDFGDEIHFVIFNPENERSGSSEVRLIEQQTSLHKLGIPLENLKLIDSLDDDNKYEHMVATLDAYKPDILFLPWMNDSHQHHRKVSRLGQAVLRKRNIQGFYYYSGSSVDFQANTYSKIDHLFKSALLDSFSSQLKNNSLNKQLIMDYNKYCGDVMYEPDYMDSYAEPFHVKRMRYPFD